MDHKHILDIFLACHDANELYDTDTDSNDEGDSENVVDEDVESNCSVYGSTTSNEGDIRDEDDYEDLDKEDVDGPSSDVDGDNSHANNLLEVGNNYENIPNLMPLAHQGEDDVHQAENIAQEFGNGNNSENIQQGYVQPGMVSSINGILPEVRDDNDQRNPEVPSLCFSSLQLNQPISALPSPGQGDKRKNSFVDHEDKEVKRMKTDECPQDIAEEITIKTDESSLTDFSGGEVYPNIDSLPDDMLLEIFSKLSFNTLVNIAPVCKRWYELSKHRSLWLRGDVVCGHYHVNEFLRYIRAAKYLRTVDVSVLHADHGEALLTLLNGPECVRRFCCFSVAHPSVIVELLERYKDSLEELNISLSDERLSYGEGGTFKDGVKPRPGYLLKLISEMKNLRVLRLTGNLPSIGHHQGRVNPKWYFGELENPDLKLQAIAMKFEKPREVLVQKFIVPFLNSKTTFLKELRLTSDLWENEEVQGIVRKCHKLEALVRFPIDSLHALENCTQQCFIDFILGSWIDYTKVQEDLDGSKALSHIHEVSLRFCDHLYIKSDDQIPDTRLETFLPFLAGRLHSCRRVHIFRWDAAPPFVESVHSTCALTKFLYTLRRTLEEVHISDAFRGGRHFPQLMKAIKESVPHLKSRGISVNRLGNRGLLFSVRRKQDSVIPNTPPLSVEYGKIEFGPP